VISQMKAVRRTGFVSKLALSVDVEICTFAVRVLVALVHSFAFFRHNHGLVILVALDLLDIISKMGQRQGCADIDAWPRQRWEDDDFV